MLLENEIPKVITKEIVLELQKISNLFELSKENKLFLDKLIKRSELNENLYVENNIDKTIDNINEDLNKVSFTGKELKDIIANHKFNQYNMVLTKLFKDIAELAYIIQFKKENEKLIDSVDIFTILYISKYIEEISEKTLLKENQSFFYENKEYSSIFEEESEENLNPFLNFLNLIPNIEISTDSLIDKQSIDDLFYIE